ncbi:hypothetical protein C2G38_2039070 [Gigaspora rosea]|uniref:Uncharacterized protein n=1 Tax=Gigaspora rosea TaxID=44941 RepID=A0A397V0C5_9GLOM|nr:hypothetical protein C2G38_2039070 [Gigaspora rosea]
MGLSGIALVEDGRMNPLNDEDLSAGLVLPTTAAILLGKTGAIAVLVLVFMAVIASITVSGIVAIIWSLFSSPSHELRKVKQILEIQTNDDVYIRHEAYQDPLEQNFLGLKKAFKCAIWSSVILTIILAFIIPLIMIKSKYIFTEEVFVFWVVLANLWAIISTCAILIYPVGSSLFVIFFMNQENVFQKSLKELYPSST